ncbi:hypothetical protein EJ05DRAFT_348893 [Pseudovirgaria hyperparasitica]|uniref:Uncharacterized protein n=1 Tax=Pseudovirgaria hyperparasitica TaxID=470096 RepID=A0A6A6W743_9PEZI|nr:uncharacterized protein EJ05DRAFT_348893 [Pseudovirgaria hyperparasitica]KAF2758365.1 hypothetical protein EJ05DRAFT_348893 [Pseudovirgaria hyperparasitica]
MSSPRSFTTAAESHSSPKSKKGSSPAIASSYESPSKRSKNTHSHFYRPVKKLPYELLNHAYVYMSEEGYSEAISLLTKFLEAGYGASDAQHPSSALVPPGQYISLLATLIVHPKYSTHAKSADAAEVCLKATTYIRSLARIVGSINVNLSELFKFPDDGSNRRSYKPTDDVLGGGLKLPQRIANSGSLWVSATSFWQVVGWAFNCSVRNKLRWTRWRQFLEVMVDVMEDDWAARLAQVDVVTQDTQGDILQKSLVWSYMRPESPGSSTGRRKILRAIFADGSKKSRQLYREVFYGESEPPKGEDTQSKGRLKKINIDENDFGDYETDSDNDETDEALVKRTRASRGRSSTLEDDSEFDEDLEQLTGADILGGIEALRLRQRLLDIMSEVSFHLPKLMTDQAELFDNITEFMNPLPCSVYPSLLYWPSMSLHTQNHLNSVLLFDIVRRSFPPKEINVYAPSVAHIKEHYLPSFAKTQSLSNHAKVVVILENILCNLIRRMKLDSELRADVQESVENGSFRISMSDGIARREKRALGDGRVKGKGLEGEEALGRKLLDASTMRLRLHMDMLESSKCYGRSMMTVPKTPSRARYVLIETPTPQKRKLFTDYLPPSSRRTSSSLSVLSETPELPSTPRASESGDDGGEADDRMR